METDHIDELLERYLHLLHEYTTLRDRLNSLQTGMYQNIARANFAAERGMRFGPDYYDERMQALRNVSIALDEEQDVTAPVFTVTTTTIPEAMESKPSPDSAKGATITTAASEDDGSTNSKGGGAKEPQKQQQQQQQQQQRKDPLRWFGLLTPAALRQAQAQSVEAVEQVVPKLVTISTRMAQVEIEVRRARKRRAKAEAAAAKKEQEQEQERERDVSASMEVAV